MKTIIVFTSIRFLSFFLSHCLHQFLIHNKKILRKKFVLIFCYIFFSQKAANISSFVFSTLTNTGLCFTTKKKWRHCSANSTCMSLFDGHVWNHLWVKGTFVKSFDLIDFELLRITCIFSVNLIYIRYEAGNRPHGSLNMI